MQASKAITNGFYNLGPPPAIDISPIHEKRSIFTERPASPFSVIKDYFSDSGGESPPPSPLRSPLCRPKAPRTEAQSTPKQCKGVTGTEPKTIPAPLDSLISSVCSADDNTFDRCKNCRGGFFVNKERLNKPSQETQFCSGECLWSWRFSQGAACA